MTTLMLSIEEVAFAMGYLGGSDVAAGYLTALVGTRPADELTGRMAAASHSLLARGLLNLDTNTGNVVLDGDLAQALQGMLSGNNSVRFSGMAGGAERTVTFFLDGAVPLRHELHQDVVSELELLLAATDVVTGIVRLVVAGEAPMLTGVAPVGRVNPEALRRSRLAATAKDAGNLVALLGDGLSHEIAMRIAATMRDEAAVWSTTLRLEPGVDGAVSSSRGFFAVSAPNGGWLFDLTADSAQAEVFLLNADTVRAAATRLLAA